VRAAHLVLDSAEAEQLQRDWIERGLGDRVPLDLIDCPDRRLVRGASKLALRTVIQDEAEVTVLLPRRSFRRVTQRLLHDRTADRIAYAVSRIPHVAATIVPFDTTLSEDAEARISNRRREAALDAALTDDIDAHAHPDLAKSAAPHVGTTRRAETARGTAGETSATTQESTTTAASGDGHLDPDAVTPISKVHWRQQVTIEGRIKVLQVGTAAGRSLEAQVFDETGGMRLLFFGRTHIAGIQPGVRIRASGRVGEYKGHLALANPRYELISDTSPALNR
jgi:hypothetical protein